MTDRIRVKYKGEKPHQGSELAAGYDIRADGDYTIQPSSCGTIRAKTALQPSFDYCHIALPRSSLCNKQGIILMNSVGLIDPDYTGFTVWNFWNLSSVPVTISDNERIGQVMFIKRVEAEFVDTEFDDTERGANGFGHSGKF